MIDPLDGPSYWQRQAYTLGGLIKQAAVDGTAPAYSLAGMLYVSGTPERPWGNLSVPNAMVRGIFDAMDEPGIELPLTDGKFAAHITVFRPEELATLGGPDAIKNDRGKTFRYTLGRLLELQPDGWPDVSKAWVVRVHSPELQQLRRSYGLTSLPHDGQYDFHITCAVRRKGVLSRNEKAKSTVAA